MPRIKRKPSKFLNPAKRPEYFRCYDNEWWWRNGTGYGALYCQPAEDGYIFQALAIENGSVNVYIKGDKHDALAALVEFRLTGRISNGTEEPA